MTKESKALLPVYVVVGTDELKRESVLRRLRMRLEELGDLSFNSDSFDASEDEASAILNACYTVPFASERRLVVVNDASKARKADVQRIVSYMDDPVDTTVLMLVADTLPSSSPILRKAKEMPAGTLIDCTPPKAKELPSQVMRMAGIHGLTMDLEAARRLVHHVGESTVHLDEELRKLSLMLADAGGDRTVDARLVDEVVAHVSEPKPWDFVDAFARRDPYACSGILGHMRSTSPISLLGQCVSRVRELIAAKVASEAGGDAKARVAEMLALGGKRSFVAGIRIEQARNYTMAELVDALDASLEAERAMKSGIDPSVAFTEWAFGVMGR